MPTDNPWPKLPEEPPYILTDDDLVTKSFRYLDSLIFETLPEPYIGRVNSADVIFLALNPGFIKDDIDINMKSERFKTLVRTNLSNDDKALFYYFSGGLEFTGGYKWWKSKLKPLIQDGVSLNALAEKIMCIEYFPYHSINYKSLKSVLPSQYYSFNLVRQAIKAGKLIVIMRSKKLWLEAVPELQVYPFLTLNSFQNVTISPRNLGDINYRKLLDILSSD